MLMFHTPKSSLSANLRIMADQQSTSGASAPQESPNTPAGGSGPPPNNIVPPLNNPPPNEQDEIQRIARISVRPPPFWRENPALWFRQLESQFITNGITVSDTKFHIAVSALDTAVISQVSDLVMNPPAQGKYELLKQRLQERFADSEEHRFRKLLSNIDLGDRKPSHLWREMRELAGNNHFNKQILKSLWMQRLPAQSQAILSAEEGNMERLLTLADRIHDIFGAREISAISAQSQQPSQAQASKTHTNNSASQPCAISQLCEQVCKLTKQVAALSTPNNNSNRSRSRTKKSSDRSRSRNKTAHDNCWYHHRYGKDANKCIPPCKYKEPESEN